MTAHSPDWVRTLRRIALGRRKELADITEELRRQDARTSELVRRIAEAERELAEVEAKIDEYERGGEYGAE